ncbi:MAG: BatD family protein [Legionella sp.]
MKRIIIIGFFCLFSALANATLQVQVEPYQVSIDESFRLILTQDTLQNGGIPDLTPLQQDFQILGTSRRMNYSVVNGQSQSSSEWVITLKAQKEGKLTIPSIKMGRDHSSPTTIEVTTGATSQNAADNSNQRQDIYLTVAVNKKNPYVNQQVIYKVTLYNSKHLLDADYKGPQVENALLVPLGDAKRYQTQQNGINYLVEEQNYAVFPQKSGPLKIKSPVFTALIYDFNPERVKVKDEPINLEVQPIPKEYSGNEWLPAQDVKLTEQYENNEQTITQGNTLIRTVTLEGVGIPAQLLPTLHFADSEGVNVYPEKGKEENRVTQGEIIGRMEMKVTYLFNKAGKITIPELKLTWFNTETGKEEHATLPAKTFEVTPSTTTPAASTNQKKNTQNQYVPESSQKAPVSNPPEQTDHGWLVAALFACAWLLTIILWASQKYFKNTGKSRYKAALKRLYKACMQGNPESSRDTLLKWASLYWPDAPILNLTELTSLSTDASFKKQVQILSQVLYKSQERTLWRGDELWRSIQQLKKTQRRKKETSNVLPPINP